MQKPPFVSENEPLIDYNTWKVGGAAEYFALPSSLAELKTAYDWALAKGLSVTVISSGSNVLISDAGIPGLVVCMRALTGLESETVDGALRVTAWSGTSKAEALKAFLKHKLPPALFLTGLPGDLGGGVVMNAGVSEARVPREFCEITEWIEVLKPKAGGGSEIRTFTASDIQWSYRSTRGWQPGVITRIGLRWPLEPDPEIMVKIKEATRSRIQKQPLDKPSCGSTFRNPEGAKAGQLIDQAGLKGFRIGGAEVSRKHANFIITEPGASARDVHDVIESVKKTVHVKFGVELHTEVVYLGKW